MKPSKSIIMLLVTVLPLFGGESTLTTTYQPLDGLASGTITIAQVTCHDWYAFSGQPTAIGLISAPNIPPTNNPKLAKENLNLASVCGIHFICSDIDTSGGLTLDASDFVVPKRFAYPRDQIIRACLECLRRCIPAKLRGTPVTVVASDENKTWIGKIVNEFNVHDRNDVFFIPLVMRGDTIIIWKAAISPHKH